MVNSHCGFTAPNAKSVTDNIERAYSKMSEEERAEIDRLAATLRENLENLYTTRTGRKKTNMGVKASRELLGKLGIWIVKNNVERRFVVVDRAEGQELEQVVTGQD